MFVSIYFRDKRAIVGGRCSVHLVRHSLLCDGCVESGHVFRRLLDGSGIRSNRQTSELSLIIELKILIQVS